MKDWSMWLWIRIASLPYLPEKYLETVAKMRHLLKMKHNSSIVVVSSLFSLMAGMTWLRSEAGRHQDSATATASPHDRAPATAEAPHLWAESNGFTGKIQPMGLLPAPVIMYCTNVILFVETTMMQYAPTNQPFLGRCSLPHPSIFLLDIVWGPTDCCLYPMILDAAFWPTCLLIYDAHQDGLCQ